MAGLTLVMMLPCALFTSLCSAQNATWGEQAASAVLENKALSELGTAALPAYKAKQMAWPSKAELASSEAAVAPELVDQCVTVLKQLTKEDSLPQDLPKHLVALKKWGLYRNASEQKEPVDVFLVRFTKGHYTVQIQEFNHLVVLTIADNNLAAKASPDLKKFVTGIAQEFLNGKLAPDAQKDMFEFNSRSSANGSALTSFVWAPPSIVSFEDGKKKLDMDAAKALGTYEIDADTDGRFVSFEIHKYKGGPASPRADVNRFDAPAKELSTIGTK